MAIDGGTPVRATPLPWELPGAHWIGAEERELVLSVVDAKSPFRFYGLDLQHCVDRLEDAWRENFGHPYALAVNCGTAALHIVLAAMHIGPGDEKLRDDAAVGGRRAEGGDDLGAALSPHRRGLPVEPDGGNVSPGALG